MITGTYAPAEIRFYRGLGGGAFAAHAVIAEERDESAMMACTNTADWDGDGDLDLIIGDVKGAVFLNRNLGSKTEHRFGAREPLRLADGSPLKVCQKSDPLPVDWDGDGRLDLLVGDEAGDATFFRGRADGTFEAGISLFTGLRHASPSYGKVRESLGKNPVIPGYRLRLAVADWNRDGGLDLLIGNCETTEEGTTGFVRVMLRQPTP